MTEEWTARVALKAGPHYPLGSQPAPMDGPGRDITSGQTKAFDAELYAIYQAAMRFGKRRERDQECTIFIDSQAAINGF